MTDKDPRLSHQTLRVLRLFLENPREGLAGSDVCTQTGILSGTVYPILLRFEKAGWLESSWEELDPSEAGRPRKRFYRLTAQGFNKICDALDALGVPTGETAWTG